MARSPKQTIFAMCAASSCIVRDLAPGFVASFPNGTCQPRALSSSHWPRNACWTALALYVSVVGIPAKAGRRAAPIKEGCVSHQGLGDFEQMVLLAILQLRGEVYGV